LLEQGVVHRDVPVFAEAPAEAAPGAASDEDTPIADIMHTPTLRTMRKEGLVDGPGDTTGDSLGGMGRHDGVEAISVDEAEK
jgi:hypothetical protein